MSACYFIGLDPSARRSGLVVLNSTGAVVLRETIGATVARRPCHTLRQRIEYWREVATKIRTLLRPYEGQSVLCIEGYAMHSPGNPTIAPELGGIVRLWLLDAFDPIEVTPGEVKCLATGKGNAKKDEVMAGARARWGFDCGGDDNIADSFTLARWAMGDRPTPKVKQAKAKMPKLTSNLAPRVPKPPKAKKLSRKAQRRLELDAAADAAIASAPF